MALPEYVSHLDARMRNELVEPAHVASPAWLPDGTATWRGHDRSVDVRFAAGGNDEIEFVLQLMGDELPYDRFVDHLSGPDIAATGRKIADFFNDGELEEELRSPA
jgi:hypothetical protein